MSLEAQLMRQTEGWLESVAAISATVAQDGPFDGCLAFSQGCSIAASMAALQQLKQFKRVSELSSRCRDAVAFCNWDLAFVMLCSGHAGVSPEATECIAAAAPMQLPSLHVYGGGTRDGQVWPQQSASLADHFSQPQKRVHERGHVIPSARQDVEAYEAFFVAARAAKLAQRM